MHKLFTNRTLSVIYQDHATCCRHVAVRFHRLDIANRPALRHYVDQQRRKYPLPFLIKILRGRMFNRGMHVWSILGDRAMQWRRAGLPGDDFFGGLYGKECAARIAAEDKQQPAQHDSTVNWSIVNRWWRFALFVWLISYG